MSSLVKRVELFIFFLGKPVAHNLKSFCLINGLFWRIVVILGYLALWVVVGEARKGPTQGPPVESSLPGVQAPS